MNKFGHFPLKIIRNGELNVKRLCESDQSGPCCHSVGGLSVCGNCKCLSWSQIFLAVTSIIVITKVQFKSIFKKKVAILFKVRMRESIT